MAVLESLGWGGSSFSCSPYSVVPPSGPFSSRLLTRSRMATIVATTGGVALVVAVYGLLGTQGEVNAERVRALVEALT